MTTTEKLPLFVYGTLRRGGRYHEEYLAGRFDDARPAKLPHFKKVVGSHGFDVAVPAAGDSLEGELFDLSAARYDETLSRCDELEELWPGELRGAWYQRVAREVTCGGTTVRAWVYIGVVDG